MRVQNLCFSELLLSSGKLLLTVAPFFSEDLPTFFLIITNSRKSKLSFKTYEKAFQQFQSWIPVSCDFETFSESIFSAERLTLTSSVSCMDLPTLFLNITNRRSFSDTVLICVKDISAFS